MKKTFLYDSPLMQVLGFIGDLFITNVLFLLCCLPIVTIGAAQSGLYNAMRILQDREDDRSCVKAFFRGFKNGFWRITPIWVLFLIFDVMLLYTMLMCWSWRAEGVFMHWGIPFAALCLSMLLHSQLTVFHSQFSCTAFQLLRNSIMLLLFHPIRSVVTAVLIWLPAVLFFLDGKFNMFMQITPLFLTVYYSVACMLGAMMMLKPFKKLIDNYDEHAIWFAKAGCAARCSSLLTAKP